MDRPVSRWEFAQEPIPLTIVAFVLGLLGVRYFTPLLFICECILIFDFYRYGISVNKKWSNVIYAAFVLATCAALVFVNFLLARPDKVSVLYRPPTEEEQLCPHPLAYSMRELPKPVDNNYSTELTFKNEKEPMLSVRVYMRTLYSFVNMTYPLKPQDRLIGLGLYDWDKSYFEVTATKGVPEYRLEIHTFQPLRLKCINQLN